MFDRIAGVYDLLNTVMTAGPAPSLARARGRSRAASARAAACWTSPPAPAIWRSSSRAAWRPAARWSAATSPRRCCRARAAQGDAARAARRRCASSGATRSRCPTPTTASTPPPSASGRATSPTWRAGWPRWRASCARRAGSWCSRSPPLHARRCRSSTRSGSTASSRCSAGWRARSALPRGLGRRRDPRIADAYTYLPDRSSASRRRQRWPPRWSARAWARSATAHGRRHRCDPCRYRSRAEAPAAPRRSARGKTVCPARARRRPEGELDGVEAIMRRGGDGLRERMVAAERHLERVTGRPARRSRRTPARRSWPGASACARCSWCSPRRPPAARRRRGRRGNARCARRSPSSSCTRRRSSTTT